MGETWLRNIRETLLFDLGSSPSVERSRNVKKESQRGIYPGYAYKYYLFIIYLQLDSVFQVLAWSRVAYDHF